MMGKNAPQKERQQKKSVQKLKRPTEGIRILPSFLYNTVFRHLFPRERRSSV